MSPLHMAAERGRFDPIVDQLTLHDEKAINIQDNSGVNTVGANKWLHSVFVLQFYSRTPLQKMVRNLYYRSTVCTVYGRVNYLCIYNSCTIFYGDFVLSQALNIHWFLLLIAC